METSFGHVSSDITHALTSLLLYRLPPATLQPKLCFIHSSHCLSSFQAEFLFPHSSHFDFQQSCFSTQRCVNCAKVARLGLMSLKHRNLVQYCFLCVFGCIVRSQPSILLSFEPTGFSWRINMVHEPCSWAGASYLLSPTWGLSTHPIKSKEVSLSLDIFLR